ncbi:MAG: hypothetical protein LBS69_11010 [Prevotellaceae bacterium]|jgi:hypothetical protein|nr:hypothetical protein [Prevotellaceae bacterium]
MKRCLFILAFIFVGCAVFAQAKQSMIKDCAITKDFGFMSKTFELWGTVRIVTDPKEHSDFDVRLVKSPGLAAMYIKITEKPSKCGEWRFVKNAEDADFSIRFITDKDEWVNFTICFVNSEPGSRY